MSYLAPQRADQHLQTQIAELMENTQELTDLLNKGIAATSNAALIQVSNQVISSGQTLYSGSIAGGSVLGKIDSTKTDAVHEWLSQASQINSHVYQPSLSTVSDDDDSIFSAPANAASGTHTSTTRSTADVEPPHSSHIFKEPIDVDSDDEFLIDAITQSIASGRASFNERNYQEASDALKEAFNTVLELPIKQQGICNTTEIIYILAVCAFHLQDPASAKTALIGVIEAKVGPKHTSTLDVSQRLHALQVLHCTTVLSFPSKGIRLMLTANKEKCQPRQQNPITAMFLKRAHW